MYVGKKHPSVRSLAGGLVCLALAAALAGCYVYYPGTETGSISLSSPTASVYAAAPTLTYSASHDVQVTLNGAVVTTVSGQPLSGAVTGLNTVVVTELSSQGGEITHKDATFFLNDKAKVDSSGFTALTGWTSSTSYGVGFTVSDTLAVSGGSSINGQGIVSKTYAPATETPCVQSHDVLVLKNTSANATVGFTGSGAGEMLGAQLVKSTATALTLNITETSPTKLASPYYKVVATSELSASYSAGTPITVYFLRSGGVYQAVAADASGSILASTVSAASYAPVITLAGRGIILQPYDQTSNSGVMVEVDNYAYYK
jgi:hypothetical protein